MDNLITEMSGEAFAHIAKLVETKLNQTPPEDLRDRVNKILDALYGPIIPKIEKVDRLVGFLRDTYDGMDKDTSNELTFQIHDICRDVRTKFDNRNNKNGQHSHNILNNPMNAGYKPNMASDVDNVKKDKSPTDMVSFAFEPKWLNNNKKLGRMVRILAGLHYGSTARVHEIENNRYLILKFADGKTGKYTINQVEFIE